jgi:hypothetical protein
VTIRRIMPGIYDAHGELHVDCVELCLELGWLPTRANQDRAGDLVRDILVELLGENRCEVVEEVDRPLPWQGQG